MTSIENTIYSITLAKLNIVNPIILDSNEIKNVLINEDFANVSISDILSISKLKVFQANNNIYFVIKYPKISNVCNKIKILPVIHKNMILNLETNTVAECQKAHHPLYKCKEATSITFCQPLKNSSCIQQLLDNHLATCKTTSSDHISPIEEVDNGVVVINNQLVEVCEIDNSTITLNGTFLVIFESKVTINDTTFTNWKNISYSHPEATSAQFVNITEHVTLLSLPYLHNANIKNIGHIASLKELIHLRSRQWVIDFIVAMAFVVTIFVGKLIATKRRKNSNIIVLDRVLKEAEDVFTSKGE